MPPLKVLIIGASIAGPTTAYWFAKAGAHVTLIERFPALRTSGQNIDIRSAGVTVMRKMPGMEAAVRANSADIDGVSFVGEDGRPFATMRATGSAEQQGLVSEYEILRGDLGRVLYGMTEENERVRYVFGEQVVAMRHGEEGEDGPVTVEFANGLPTAEYDLVVACDGAHSRTRAMALNCGVRGHITPLNVWAAYFSISRDLLQGSKIGQGFSSTGGRFLAVGPDPHSHVNRVTFMKVYPRGSEDATLPFREAAKRGTDAVKQYISNVYRDVGWKTREVLEGMMEADDFYTSEAVKVKVPILYKGRVALVGDAGTAPGFTGTGTTLALVGGYLLAGEVGCRHKGDLAAGLAAYDERMRPIVKEMQQQPPGIPWVMAPQTRFGIRLRNWLIAVVCWVMASRLSSMFAWVGQLLGSAFGKDTYGLPEYEWEA
ncbi:hypothetical protein LTR85_000836 [Meristemomyces frigidus]|nr:hypothetical protein LTR85_000836 [Meristemomyces frigidus]